MTPTAAPPWEAKRTEETRQVEDLLLGAGFNRVDAYRYNLASIRVRVIDPRFEGLAAERRDALVEPLLERLPESIQADILGLFTFAPSEIDQTPRTLADLLMNTEFVNPSPSML